jgi:dipeptidyl aminopeptidase/acylaminoacyl peptidase/TPR repeat protein
MNLFVFSLYNWAAPIPAKELFTSPTYSMLQFTHDGTHISAMQLKENELSLIIFDINSGVLSKIGKFSSEDRVTNYKWIANNVVLIQIFRNGFLNNVLVTVHQINNILRIEPSTVKYKGYFVSTFDEQKDSVLFALTDEAVKGLYAVPIKFLDDTNIAKWQKLESSEQDTFVYSYDNESKKLIAGQYKEETKSFEFKYRLIFNSNWKHLLNLKKAEYTFRPLGFLSENKLAVLSNKNTDKIALYNFDIAKQILGEVIYEHDKYDLTGAEISVKTGALESVQFIDHGQSSALYFNHNKQKEAHLLKDAFKNKQVGVVAQNLKKGLKIIKTTSSDDPGTYLLFDSNKNTAELLFNNYPNLSKYKLTASVPLTITTSDNFEVEAIFTHPENDSNNSLLVIPHGGPVGIRDYDSFNRETQYFASRGFSVLKVNFRGSEGFGKAFKESGVGQFGKLIERDINTVVDSILASYQFKNICAIGASYGGYSSVMLALKQPERYKCVVASYGIYDLPLLFNASNFKIQDEYRQSVANAVGEYSDELLNISPVYLTQEFKTPTLLIAGKNDDIAGFEQSHRLKYVLEKAGTPLNHLFYERTGHGHNTWWGDRHEHTYINDFLEKTLGLPDRAFADESDEYKTLLSEDLILVGHSLFFNDIVENDAEMALYYYRKAAKLGNPEAYYFIGRLYDKLWVEPITGTEYIENYIKASSLGDGDASYRLGEIYFQGETVKADYEKSLDYIKLAASQRESLKIEQQLAKVNCLGAGVKKDVNKCIEYLNLLESVDTNSKEGGSDDLAGALIDIFSKGTFNKKELQLLHDLVNKKLDVEIYPLNLEVSEYGEYAQQEDGYFDYNGSQFITPQKGISFGLRYYLSSASFSISKKETALIIKWIRQDKSGETLTYNSTLQWGMIGGDSAIFNLDFKHEIDAAAWRFEFYDLYGNQIYQQTFQMKH